MKFAIFIFIFLISSVCIAQKKATTPSAEVNKDNSLDLKIVFQKYTIQSRTGYTESKYPLLKVNNKYLENDNTGINEKDFKKYLSGCPKALAKANLGLKGYEKADKTSNTGFLISLAAYGVGGYFGYNGLRNDSKKDLYIAGGFALGGIITNQIFNYKAGKITEKSNQDIISAFDLYRTACFKPILQDTTPGQNVNDVSNNTNINKDINSVNNGEFNDNEKVQIMVLDNNCEQSFTGVALGLNILYVNRFNLAATAQPFYYKNGLGFNGKFDYLMSFSGLFEDEILGEESNSNFNFNVGGSITLPITKKLKDKKNLVYLGKSRNIDFMSQVILKNQFSFGFDLGIRYRSNQFNSDGESSFFNEDAVGKLTELKIGPSYTRFGKVHYKVDDDRFKINKKVTSIFRYYGHVIYGINNSFYNNDGEKINTDDYNKLGGVLGLWLAGIFKSTGFHLSLEGGMYPHLENATKYGGELSLAFVIGK